MTNAVFSDALLCAAITYLNDKILPPATGYSWADKGSAAVSTACELLLERGWVEPRPASQIEELTEALSWYGEQASLINHRNAPLDLAADGGKRAKMLIEKWSVL